MIAVPSYESRGHAAEKERQAMKTTGCRRETNEAVPQEPNLSDVPNDPVVRAVMRADNVSPNELTRTLGISVCGGAGQPTKDRLRGWRSPVD